MLLFKKWARHKVKSYIYCVNQFLREKSHNKWNQECKQKQSLLFNFCNIFDLLTSRAQKIAWWPCVFKSDFYIFSYNEKLRKIYRNFIDKFLSYHTSLILKVVGLPFRGVDFKIGDWGTSAHLYMGWKKFHAEPVYFFIVFFWWQKG